MYRRFTWRILSNYVTPWEFEQLKAQITDYGNGAAAWSAPRGGPCGTRRRGAGRRAHRHRRGRLPARRARLPLGELRVHPRPGAVPGRAGGDGRGLGEGRPAAVAADGDPGRPVRGPDPARLPAAARRRRTGHRSCCCSRGPIRPRRSFSTWPITSSPAGWRSPRSTGPARACVSFDSKLRPDQEVAVRAILDALAARPDLDGGRVGVGGISYGGLFAIRTAAADNRVRAVFTMSSLVHPGGPVRRAMDELTRPGQYQHHGPDPAANMAAMTVAGAAARATAPLLQVYGGSDPGSPPAHAERIAAEYAGPVTTVVYPGRRAHPEQRLEPGPAAGGRLARRHPLTGAGPMVDYLNERGQAGGAGAVHRPVGRDHHPVRRRRDAGRGGAAAGPGPAHRRPADRRGLLRRGHERVLGAVRRGAAAAGGGGGGLLPGPVPGARAHRPPLRGRDDRADPARGARRRRFRGGDQPVLPARLGRRAAGLVHPGVRGRRHRGLAVRHQLLRGGAVR